MTAERSALRSHDAATPVDALNDLVSVVAEVLAVLEESGGLMRSGDPVLFAELQRAQGAALATLHRFGAMDCMDGKHATP